MIEELIRSRRSVRRFKTEAPSRADIERLIAMAVQAPSASNKQPWRFVVVTDRVLIARMADAVQAAVDRIVPHVRAEFIDAFRAYGSYFVRFREAPVVIVPIFRELVVLSNLVDEAIDPADAQRIGAAGIPSGPTTAGRAPTPGEPPAYPAVTSPAPPRYPLRTGALAGKSCTNPRRGEQWALRSRSKA